MNEADNCRTILLTGSTSGIGREIARAALSAGHTVIAAARTQAEGQSLDTDRYWPVTLDLADKHSVVSVLERVPKHLAGRIDALINAAAVDLGGKAPFVEMDFDDITTTIDTNLTGLVLLTRVVAPVLLAQPRGDIVNVSAMAVANPSPGLVNYAGTKFGLHGFTLALRKELASSGVRVTEVFPGIVRTGFATSRWKGDAARATTYYDSVPAILDPEDVASAILFCLSQPSKVTIPEISIVPSLPREA